MLFSEEWKKKLKTIMAEVKMEKKTEREKMMDRNGIRKTEQRKRED